MPDETPERSDGVTGGSSDGSSDGSPDEASSDLPQEVIQDAERLTRLARGAVDEDEAAAYRAERDELLADHGFTARVREEGASDDATLVCYPDEWVEDGVAQLGRIDDVDRGVERALEGPGEENWDAVAETNAAVVERVEATHGDPHCATAAALADFANNHYAKPIAELTPEELAEFEDEYFPRNAWPSEEQTEAIEDSLDVVFEEIETASGDPP